jgi:S-adenosylmethionine synthetase
LLAGRAVSTVGGEVIPVPDIALEGSRALLKDNLHALDADHHVRIETLVQQGSQDLQSLFSRRGAQGVSLANDRHWSRALERARTSRARHRTATAWSRSHALSCQPNLPSCGPLQLIKVNHV